MINIDVVVKSKKWGGDEWAKQKIAKFVTNITKKLILLTELNKIIKNDFNLDLSVSLVSNSQIKKINNQFRNKNKVTDVLSFPALDEKLIRKIGLKKLLGSDKYLFLGDIVIANEILKKESAIQNKKFENHLTHMILHSILHLIGHDHEDEKMAQIMEDLEIKILKKLKISNPYINN